MPGGPKETLDKIRKLPFEEKLELLSQSDKDYLHGYIDRALLEQAQKKKEK